MEGADGCKLFFKKILDFLCKNAFQNGAYFSPSLKPETGVKMYSNTKFLLRKFVSIKAFYFVAAV
jgi:hypothetical protein